MVKRSLASSGKILYAPSMAAYTTHSKEETKELGKALAFQFLPPALITFSGGLGAGKTTLIQGVLESLGALPPYPSPTFVLMNEHILPQPTKGGVTRIYHADAYRVGSPDFEKLGFVEWCADPEALVLLEWPERIAEILPKQRINITLKTLSETEREITLVGQNLQ